jgi:hypothetical protein
MEALATSANFWLHSDGNHGSCDRNHFLPIYSWSALLDKPLELNINRFLTSGNKDWGLSIEEMLD